MKKAKRIIFIVLFAVILIGTFAFLWKKANPPKDEFEAVTPKIGNIERKTIATGKIEPRNEVLIKPQISGIITEIYKQAGDKITAGEIIAKVKVIPEMVQINSAESRLNQAGISLEQAQDDYNRVNKLYNSGVVSKEDYLKSQFQLKKAKEDKENSQDALNIIREGISKKSGSYSTTQIRATISGTILDVPVKVGNSVIQSNSFNDGTTIASVANLRDMIFKGKIDETEVGKIKENMPLTLTLGALQEKKFDAILEYISPKGVEENGAILFEIKAAAKIPENIFVRAGYSANAEITLDKRMKVLTIPESVVEFENNTSYVNILKKNGKGQEFDRKAVKLGLSDGINIQVVSGITIKDKLKGALIKKDEVKKKE
jgi:HlyD family secretion protein